MDNQEKIIILLLLGGIAWLAFSRNGSNYFGPDATDYGVNAPYYQTYNTTTLFTGGGAGQAIPSNSIGFQNANGGATCDTCSLFPSMRTQL